MANDEALEWMGREKLIDWLKTGQCIGMRLHRFEFSFIRRAVACFVETHNLNPVAREVYDHLVLMWNESEIPYEYPSLKALKKLEVEDEP